jgi:response regulator RpfG family c-di-GMP phosphodiesterase
LSRWSGLNSGSPRSSRVPQERRGRESEEQTAPLRILIADDDPMIPELLQERVRLVFSDRPPEVMIAGSAEEALDLLYKERIDLLLSDYDFSSGCGPEAMNGLALLREIERLDITVTPIFMTGFGDEEVAKNAILLGAVDYLTKPTLNGLPEVLGKAEEAHRKRREQAALRNAARLLDISDALRMGAPLEHGASQILAAVVEETDCDAAWVQLATPENLTKMGCCETYHNFTLPPAQVDEWRPPSSRGAFVDAASARSLFPEAEIEGVWVQPLTLERGGEPSLLGSIGIAYSDRLHRLHPGRRQTVAVIGQQAESLLASRALQAEADRASRQTIEVLVRALELHDEYTAGHSDWVSVYTRLLGHALAWSPYRVERAGHAGLLHDIGKVRMDPKVINHNGPLSDEQRREFQQHTIAGRDMLLPLESMADVIPAVYGHHERWVGGGYPVGLEACELPALARATCIADAYDAMTSHRAYRRARPHDAALRELRRCKGTQFDPDMVAPFTVYLVLFRRLVATWAAPLFDGRNALPVERLYAAANLVVETPPSPTELAVGDDEHAGALCKEYAAVPRNGARVVDVVASLEGALIEAGERLLAALAQGDGDGAALIERMEAMTERPDHRITRLLAWAWDQRRAD